MNLELQLKTHLGSQAESHYVGKADKCTLFNKFTYLRKKR